jgi:archaellum biogenesis ATPase FlaH
MAANAIPHTYIVRTGRRPGFGFQLYFRGSIPDVGLWQLGGCEGQIKSLGGYVMAAGCVHPSGAEYEKLLYCFETPATTPDVVRSLKTKNKQVSTELGKKVPEGGGRHDALMRVACGLRNRGLDADTMYQAMIPINAAVCEVPIEDEDIREMCYGIERRYPIGAPDPEVILSAPKEPKPPVDWRTRYMTEQDYLNVKPPEFLIDGFLVRRSIAMLAGPVATRKTILALNIAHASCTGEPLFGYFNVTSRPERVVYLCPEMGAASFVKRIKQIGLGQYISKSLFVQTMSDKPTMLDELDGELPGAVVIVDSITRFIDGDENKSSDMREFAQKVFRLVNAGATVILLHHSKKGSSGSLDDGLRGSSELAAFVDSCWVTELEDPNDAYHCLSKMRNVKQRDFESKPFKIKPTESSYRLLMNGEPEDEVVLKSKAESAALDALSKLLAANPKMGINKLRDELKKSGHSKGQKWITAARCRVLGTGVTHTSE